MSDYRKSIVIDIDGKGAVVGARTIEGALKEIDSAARGSSGAIDSVGESATSAASAMNGIEVAAKAAISYLAASAFSGAVKETALLAARYETLGVVMGVVGNNAGYTRAEMDKFEAGLRKTGITAIESRNNLSAMASANMDLSKASQLARIAQDAAVVGNINSSEAFERMIGGIKSAEVEVLRGIGLNVNFEQSYQKLAGQLGKNAADLTEQEKLQARLNSVLAQAPAIAGVYEGSLTTVGKKLASTARYSEDAKVKLGAIFQPALVLLVDTYTDALKGVNAELDNTEVIQKWARVIKSEVLDIMQMGAALNMVLAKAGQAASVVGMGVYGPGAALGISNSEKGFDYFAGAYLDYQKQFADSEAYLNKLIGEQERLSTTVHQQTTDRVVEQARISAGNARRAEEAAAALNSSATRNTGSSVKAGPRDNGVADRANEKMIEDGQRAALALESYWNDYEQNRVDAIADTVHARAEAQQRDLQLVTEFADKYKEIVLGETEFKRAQIEAQAEAYRTAGADEIAVAKWVEAEKQKVSRDWQDGAVRALEAYADASMNAAALAEQAFTKGFQSMEDALVEFVMTGKTSFEDLANSIISDLARIAVQQSITGPLATAASNFDWSSLFGGGTSVASVGAPKVGYAKGGIPGASSLHAYANSIVSSPTIFPFARGVGLMGEAGPEAIMPLKRGPGGVLGVSGGGSNVQVNIIESPGNGGKTQQRQETGVNILDVMVEQIKSSIASDINRGNGVVPQAITKSYGLSRAPGAY